MDADTQVTPGISRAGQEPQPPPDTVGLLTAVQREAARQTGTDRTQLVRVERQARRVLNLARSLSPERLRHVSPRLEANLRFIGCTLGDSDDVVSRRFTIGGRRGLMAAAVFIDGLVDRLTVNEHILEAAVLRAAPMQSLDTPLASETYRQLIMTALLPSAEIRATHLMDQVLEHLLAGDVVLLLDGLDEAFLIGARSWKDRAVEEPLGEAVIRGPREGFSETLRVNTALVRRRIKDPALRVQQIKLGRRSRTEVAVIYIEGVASNRLVSEVFERLHAIDTDAVLESGYVEQFLEEHPWSPFPQMLSTERPDRVAASILEGRVAILVDGTPFALVAPATFGMFYQTPEDYYERFLIASLVRLVRSAAVALSLTLTAFYVALTSFHHEMLSTRFAIALAGARSTVPLPVALDAFFLELTMEILREASVRLPRPIGPTIGIVGTLVIGQAVIRAGLVSPVLVIVVASSTIASFAFPAYNAAIAIRILRFAILMAASVLGLFGIVVALVAILIHLTSVESFGVAYLAPFGPLRLSDLKDVPLLRAPLWMMKRRPESLQPREASRQAKGLLPHRPSRPAVESARHGGRRSDRRDGERA